MSEQVNFRLEKEDLMKLDELAKAKNLKRSDALREAVNEYLALYIVDREPTVGKLFRRMQDIEKRLAKLEDLLIKKGAEA